MNKAAIIVTLAALADNDPRLEDVASLLADKPKPERPTSFRMFRMGEAAKLTGISRATLWRAIRDGKLKSVEVRHGSHRIPENELRRFVEGRAA